jgi:hypothetical protein
MFLSLFASKLFTFKRIQLNPLLSDAWQQPVTGYSGKLMKNKDLLEQLCFFLGGGAIAATERRKHAR